MNTLSVLVILALLLAFYRGQTYGLARSFIRFGGRLLVLALATIYSRPCGAWLYQNLISHVSSGWLASAGNNAAVSDRVQFISAGIAFGLITMIGFMIVRRVEKSVRFINRMPILGSLNRLGGGVVYLILVYVELFFLFIFTQALPIPWYHDQIANSSLVQWMIEQTPYLSSQLLQMWQTSLRGGTK
ncbi:putative membrane protein required for colicin V production [Weissella uvarum]|uniref:CvpA family protein n=1 Tax=Weissella uvarum TaxID=1479233 RepID=UPI00196118B5|nr:CvpA family protein [Weissella uvarum]MBM7618114.1 putative membrane protein required for colicin V production [Weissella uvarum]MCM0595144.1 CvpA family protein [Weissella uvarum]